MFIIKTRDLFGLLSVLSLVLGLSAAAVCQEPSAEELAKKTQNPVADLISVPLQSNFNFGAGFHHNKMIYVLNVQPVIPIQLSEEWNLITRIIMPIINQPNLFPSFGGLVPSTTGTGFGDFNPTFFLSPAKPGELIWGVGPTMTLPTATGRLVLDHFADSDGGLEGRQGRRCVDGAAGRRRGEAV